MIDFDTTAEALLRLTNWWSANDVWGCGMAPTIGPSFEEAYVIRAALEADKTLHLGQVRAVAHAFCDRSLHGQDVSEENVYFMGYGMGRNENGQVCNSCVADAATVATAILETVKTYPDSAKAQDYIRSVRRFVDYVLDRYVDPDGVIGVGVLGYQVNPWTQYWCASSLFAETLLLLSEVTGEPKYLEAAVNPLAYMAQYDYRGSIDKNWSSCPDEVIFYAGEGIIAGLSSPIAGKKLNQKMEAVASESLTADSADDMMALNQMTASGSASSATNETDSTIRSALVGRWNEFAGWLYANQEMSGIWQDTRPYRGYQLGLS